MPDVFISLLISLGLGLLVGLQREHADQARIAGIRTFPLVTLLGTMTGLLAHDFGGWIIAAGLLTLGGLLFAVNFKFLDRKVLHPGQTTEVALLVMYCIGAYLATGQRAPALVMGGLVMVLLYFKQPLHQFAERLGQRNVHAIVQFVIVALIILPVLPDRTFGPYDVLNPRQLWLIVVLIVGVSVGGYFIYKLVGHKAGTFLNGLLGGVISSTATTISYARMSRADAGNVRATVLVILIASGVSFVRVLVEVFAILPQALPQVGPPLLLMVGLFACLIVFLSFFRTPPQEPMPEPENPAQLKSAVVFGLIFAVVLLATAAARDYLGNKGLYGVALFSGLTDVDAITISIAQMAGEEEAGVSYADAWRLILIGSLANMLFKGGAVAVLGSRALLRWVVPLWSAVLVGGLLLILLWPAETEWSFLRLFR
ncbi:Uncharacterized membrane protein, DUF4010 family [Catalinimonas alkaloidigena]|uniref:Uncharacterized membrane protein, DUF4010 family n=1 Tax=Catalinimonas alkaloidigena TaxID=1075417 RepID=A0A1G9EL35_9BACT|nr:DUF4010 domain-containing protein [Catalinimonas alkaloidigena]SDK76783.1 Uncharacterized membrane protein, DUF4010 family [Catalinimonas alkaloidigena]